MDESMFLNRTVKFMADGKALTGTVVSYTPAQPGNRYDTLVITDVDGHRYTRHTSTVRFLPKEK